MSDNPFDAQAWRPVDGFSDLTDITYHRHVEDATVRVAFNRPEVRNALSSELLRSRLYCERIFGDDRASVKDCLQRQAGGLPEAQR